MNKRQAHILALKFSYQVLNIEMESADILDWLHLQLGYKRVVLEEDEDKFRLGVDEITQRLSERIEKLNEGI